MSTILDALKKSEQERKLNKLPTLADKAPPPERSIWPWVVVGISLLLLGIAMAYVLWQLTSTSSPVANNSTPASSSAQSAAPTPSSLASESVQSDDRAGTPAADDIVVSVVSFAADPAQRFVIVNGQLYREGDYLRAGLRVIEIQPDSVIFDHRGEKLVRSP